VCVLNAAFFTFEVQPFKTLVCFVRNESRPYQALA
jgi:hypothetical protein